VILVRPEPAHHAPHPVAGRLAALRVPPNPCGSFDALFVVPADAGTPVAVIDGLDGYEGTRRERARRLRILHFNDLHNALQGRDATGAAVPLFSRIVRRYRDARAAAGPEEVVLLVSGGDDHTGTPFDELLGWTREEFVVDPAYASYSAAGVDVAALGNHDLDRGSAILAAGIEANADFPVLSANVAGAAALIPGRHYFAAAIGIAKGLRVGFLGLTTPVDTRLGGAADPDLAVASPLATLRRFVPALAAATDLVVVMSHCCYGVDSRAMQPAHGAGFLAEGDVAIARAAATLTHGPIVVVGAHTHTVLNADGCADDAIVDGIPIVQAGGHGSHLGELVIELPNARSRDGWRHSARVHALGGQPRGAGDAPAAAADDADDAFERAIIAPMLARVERRTAEVLATIGDDTDLSRATTLRQRYCGECALVNFVCDALVERSAQFAEGRADLAIVNSTAIADGLPSRAELTFDDWYRVQPFADTLQVAELTHAELMAILASNARRVVRPEELAGPRAVDTSGYVSRGFLHFSRELRYTLVLNANAGEAAVADATFRGRPLRDAADAPQIRVVFTNYLGAGGYAESWNGSPIGARVPGFLPGYDLRPIPKRDTGLVFRNEVIAYLRAAGRIDAKRGARLDGRLVVR